MSRLAWFTPLPPVRSGIAAYSVELLPHLAGQYDIDVFVDHRGSAPHREGAAGSVPRDRVQPGHNFVWKHSRHPYDLVVYQLGNASCHDYMWPYLVRYPGLVVLHDAELHHARAKALLTRGRLDDYRAELACAHPDAPAALSELVITGFGGSLFYFWPMIGVVVRTARLVAVHSRRLAATLRHEHPSVDIEEIRMGVADPVVDIPAGAVRARHGLPPDSVVFAAFGGLTPEKRLTPVIHALSSVVRYAPVAHLLLVGDETDYYDVRAEARAAGLADRIVFAGYVDDAALPSYLSAADVCLCLRWPTARETSASWLRCLAAGKPTVITDLTHVDDVATLDPRSWTVLQPSMGSDAEPSEDHPAPCAVSIDILDEEHSLTLATRRLAVDGALREQLGRAARRHFESAHTIDQMAGDYRRAITRGLEAPAPRPQGLPAHLLADGSEWARALAASIGVELDLWDG